MLQRPNCTIVDDASSLERLLKSKKKLCRTNFMDLFLDAESREGFQKFLEQDTDATGMVAVPHGLRVSLQGSSGPVSVDLFHTKIPKYSTMGSDYSFLDADADWWGRWLHVGRSLEGSTLLHADCRVGNVGRCCQLSCHLFSHVFSYIF